MPCLVLRGVGSALASTPASRKILILNGSLDRETGPANDVFDALGFVRAIARAALESEGVMDREPEFYELCTFVTHIIYLEGQGAPKLDRQAMAAAGIEAVRVYGRKAEDGISLKYDEKALSQALEAVVGRKDARYDKSRRNTFDIER